jgi:hypothetical protein
MKRLVVSALLAAALVAPVSADITSSTLLTLYNKDDKEANQAAIGYVIGVIEASACPPKGMDYLKMVAFVMEKMTLLQEKMTGAARAPAAQLIMVIQQETMPVLTCIRT